MQVLTKQLARDDADALLEVSESHFVDLKSAAIAPAKLLKTVSAFANTSGGDIFVGVEEVEDEEGKTRRWNGFADEEAANAIFQVLENTLNLPGNYAAVFLQAADMSGLVLNLTIFKTSEIVSTTDGKTFVRRSAQSLPVANEAALERLRYDKGIKSFENELVKTGLDEITNSNIIIEFMLDTIPTGEPAEWVSKQKVISDDKPMVSGVLLYSDYPQALLPKRSAVKILRYKTKHDAERDFLVGDPETIEGPLYTLIFDAVDRVKTIIEGIEKAGAEGLEKILYPEEALHEILTNAVLHRDYNVVADVQVRIFDNRIEIESPGRLPGHVTLANITKTQFARNPNIVRLINKFKNPPNKDVGEGLNTAIEAMGKLRLKKPVIEETENSVTVTLKHEALASPEQLVMEYLAREAEITNAIARDLTGIKSENSMKQVFYKLRDAGQLEQNRAPGKKPAWRKPMPGAQAEKAADDGEPSAASYPNSTLPRN